VVPVSQLYRVDVRDVQEGHRCVVAAFYDDFMYGDVCVPVAREGMIGWYHTGPKLRAADLEINELLKRFIARPVMVILDGVPRAQTVGIPTNAYFAVEEIKDVHVFHCPPSHAHTH
jgi:proteasome lid subunit RPN8/RPN11